jgi:hypothetical protein
LLAVFTQTNPGPPPGAAVFAAAAAAGPSFFPAGAATAAAPPPGVGACIAGTGFVSPVGAPISGAGFVSAVGAGISGTKAAYQVCTPLCPRQAPLFAAAVEYVPSRQIPFAPAGAPAGACAQTLAAPKTHTPAIIQIVFVIAEFLESTSAFQTRIPAILAPPAPPVTTNPITPCNPSQTLPNRYHQPQ